MVSGGGSPADKDRWYGGDAECPFVLARSDAFYLFRNQRYGPNNLNTQYRSTDPLDFGVNDDSKIIGTLPVAAPEIIRHDGDYYIAALKRQLNGIRVARLKWWGPTEADRYYVYDNKQNGLCMAVTKAGGKTFYLYRKLPVPQDRQASRAYPPGSIHSSGSFPKSIR